MVEMNLVIFKTREGLLRNTATHGWAMQMVRMDLVIVVRMAMLPRSKRASWYEARDVTAGLGRIQEYHLG